MRFLADAPAEFLHLDSFEAVGLKIWPSASTLVKYMASAPPAMFQGKHILEVGCGAGYVGIGAAALGAKSVILTDRLLRRRTMSYDSEGMLVEDSSDVPSRALLNLSQANADLNKSHTSLCDIKIEELEWGQNFDISLQQLLHRIPQIDVIIGADVTYHSPSLPHLFWTISRILEYTYEKRSQKLLQKGLGTDSQTEECCFIVAHERRLEKTTADALRYSELSGLQSKVLYSDSNHIIWKFLLA